MTPEPAAGSAAEGGSARRVLVLGANGPTGRLLVQQALDRGLGVRALTRHPDAFPVRHERLHVLGGDATRAADMEIAVTGCDAVVSVIGSAYTRRPVDVYSATARLLLPAMERQQVRRLLVVTSAEVAPVSARQGTFINDRVLYPLLRRVVGRTVYDDMERMERLVRDSEADWTIVRPPGLTSDPGGGYRAERDHVAGGYCARGDLAAFLLDQLDDRRFLHGIAAVASPGLRVSPIQTVRQEVLKR